MTDLETKTGTAEVSITVTVNGESKTFNATAETEGNVGAVASSLLFAVGDDAGKWAHETGRGQR